MKNYIRFFSALIFSVLIFFGTESIAQIQDLVTDRPDQTESALIVPINSLQIETGFSFEKDKFKEDGIDIEIENLILASTLFRYGISDMFEFRFSGDYLINRTKIAGVETELQGLENFTLGTKISIWKDREVITHLAVIVQTTLPFGNRELRPEDFEPSVKITASQDFVNDFSLGINLGFENDSGINKNAFTYTAAFGYDVNDRIGTYIEFYGFGIDEFLPVHHIDGGVTYLHKQNIQIDLSVGSRIFSEEKYWYGSLGFSMRLPQ